MMNQVTNFAFTGTVILLSALRAGGLPAQDVAPVQVIADLPEIELPQLPQIDRLSLINDTGRFMLLDQSCSACHQAGTPHGIATLIPGGIGAVMPGSVALGQYRVRHLNDPLIRSHLPIEDEPALIVLTVPEGEQPVSKGDIVLSIGEQSVGDLAALRKFVETNRRTKYPILLIRGGKKTSVELKAEELAARPKPYRIGVQVETPSDALRAQLNLYKDEGLLVTSVIEESPAEQAGILVHDILLRAEAKRLSDLDGLKSVVNASQGQPIQLTLMRGGKELTITTTAEQEPSADSSVWTDLLCPGQHIHWRKPVFIEIDNAASPVTTDFDIKITGKTKAENKESKVDTKE